jgi:hypothetical protein
VQVRKAAELTAAAEALRGTVLGGDAVAALHFRGVASRLRLRPSESPNRRKLDDRKEGCQRDQATDGGRERS